MTPARSRFPLVRALRLAGVAALLTLTFAEAAMSQDAERPRARDIGLEIGIFPTGAANAITDVEGVLVGQVTLREGDRTRTGVTAIRPHPGNVYRERVPAAIHVGNGFGKLIGVTQVRELGELETPILLTCTLCVWRAADAMAEWLLAMDGMGNVGSINPVVGETNDGGLNDIRSRPVGPAHVREALESARGGAVEEGSVGAGTGTRAFGWKGGIGTSSRVLPESLGGYTVGILVQSNFGGILTMGGAPVGVELGQHSFRGSVGARPLEAPGAPGASGASSASRASSASAASDASDASGEGGAGDPWLDQEDEGQGSIMIVVATDAPISSRNLERLAARAIMGLARTGSFAGNGSGDYVIAFSTSEGVRRLPGSDVHALEELANDRMSGLFQATVEATEEAILNSLLKATTVSGMGRTAEALPIAETLEVLRRYNAVPR
jgi:D-aminopeptidase